MKTLTLKTGEVKPDWWLVDGTDKVVGRLAARLAQILMGKHKPDYTPHVACGDFVVIINAEKVKFTGKKWEKKEYDKYTGYSSGRRVITAGRLLAISPDSIIRLAVKRMLPKNKLANRILRQLKVFAGPNHDHQAQQPKELKLDL